MALTQISTAGVKDDAVTSGKIPANAVGSSELADDAVDTNAIQDDAVTADKLANSINTEIAANTAKTSNATHTGDVTGSTSLTIASDAVTTAKIANEAVTLAKLEHGTSSNNGKFLRANNGADPTFETVNTTPEGTAVLSTGESGGTKFLREDGDGSCSWQAVPAAGISDVVSDTSPQLGGELDTNGSDIRFADTDEAIFGNGADLKIYHSGGENFIRGNATVSTLFIDSCHEIKLRHLDTSGSNIENMIVCNDDGAVELYYDDGKKFETVTGGATITGTCTATAFAGDGSALTGVGGGITMADHWRITSNFTGDSNPISSNWERHDTSPMRTGNLGTGLTESSGEFTFPSTGWYYVYWQHALRYTGASAWNYMILQLDNGTGQGFSSRDYTSTEIVAHAGSSWNWLSANNQVLIDITSTNQKMRFRVDNENGSVVTMGNTDNLDTGFSIFRLGDT